MSIVRWVEVYRLYRTTILTETMADEINLLRNYHRGQNCFKKCPYKKCFSPINSYQSALKEQRRRRAEKRLSKRVFLESPFLLFPP